MVMGLGHVGIICDDLMKMRDFYTRVIGLTITDEDPQRGSCFLSANPEYEHHELNLGQARGSRSPRWCQAENPGVRADVLYRVKPGRTAGACIVGSR